MFAIAGGILLAVLILGLLGGGIGLLNEGEPGCGCAILIAAMVLIGWIIL